MPAIAPAKLQDGTNDLKLRVHVDRSAQGMLVSRQVTQSGRLTSTREAAVEENLYGTILGRPFLTHDNPLLDPSRLAMLDENGLIRPGAVIHDETILASILHALHINRSSPPAQGMVRAEDRSLTAPHGWSGAIVTAASYQSRRQIGRDTPTNLVGRIDVHLRLVMPISVGEVLVINGLPLTIAGVCEATDVDIKVSTLIGKILGLVDGQTVDATAAVAEEAARWVVQARAVGPYSLITQQPLGLLPGASGQRLEAAHIYTLCASGLAANLAELTTLKCDDVGGRIKLNAALDGKGEFPTPGAPETLHVLLAELTGLGLAPAPHAAGDHTELSLTPMTDPDRLAWSSGPITKADTINYRTLGPEPNGIMCERVFGPENHPDRGRRFGHFVLADPIVPWFYRAPAPDGGPSILARILKLEDEKIAGLLEQKLRLDEEGQIVALGALTQGVLTGSQAIEQLLAEVPDDALPVSLQKRVGPRSALVAHTILLLPPDLRPLVLLDNGNFATSDLNELYRLIVNRSNRLRKLKELKAPEMLLRTELLSLQREADHLFANTLLPLAEQVCGDDGRPLKDLLGMALFRAQMRDAKRTDYSARARAVPLSAAQRDSVIVPRSIAETLKLPEGTPILVTRASAQGECGTPIIPLQVAVHEHPVIGLHPEMFDAMFPDLRTVPECIIHRPLTPAAIDEARRLSGRVLVALAPPPHSWTDEADLRVLLKTVIDAAMTNRLLPFDSPAGLLLAGPDIATFSPIPPPPVSDPQLPRTEAGPSRRKTVDIPIPPELPAASGPDLLARMRDVAMDHRRKAMVFRWERLDRQSRPDDGTIGLGPWLPPNFQWPQLRGKPLGFVAQLPIDPARAAGVLPTGALADAPPSTLLTLFWDFKTWGPVPAAPNLMQFVHTSSDLVRKDDLLKRGPLQSRFSGMTLVPEIVDEVPSWPELRDIFDFEFGRIDPARLFEFEKTVVPTLPTPKSLTKFGGWAAWIQSPATASPLLFQVASDDEVAGLMFGDCGTLYATMESGGISLATQCY